ncbi:MAG: ATP-dependent helicase [Bifidobacteriaceae bacterium]|nr:ATP-dependent helicase [Bifidobacteriaceae bacterium]
MTAQFTPQGLADQVSRTIRPSQRILLTEEQAQVIGSPLASSLVVAGAGSGKTFVMALRTVYLVANGLVQPEQILGLTFTRKAAAELNQRVRAMLGALPGALRGGEHAGWPVISTYNAYAAGIVRNYGLQLGLNPDARVLTEAQKWELAHQLVEAWDGNPDPRPSADTLTRELLDMANQCSDNLVTGAQFTRKVEAIIEDLDNKPAGIGASGRKKSAKPPAIKSAISQLSAKLWAGGLISQYAASKACANAMDFADQLAWAGRIAAQDGSAAAAAERAAYKAVLLDEFQDTSVLQIRFLSALFRNTPVMAVGDPNQAIYGWRGASAGSLPQFLEAFASPSDQPAPAVTLSDSTDASGATRPNTAVAAAQGTAAPSVLTLSVARRNDHAILDAANLIADPLREELTESLARRLSNGGAFVLPRLQPRPDAGPGDLRAAYFTTEAEEADYIAGFLREQWAGQLNAAGELRSACVLVRTKSAGQAIAAALEEAGLPCRLVQGGGLLEVPEVRDVVAALAASQDLTRGDAFMRLAASPRLGLGIADLNALARTAARAAPNGTELVPLDLVDGLARGSLDAAETGLSRPGAARLTRLGEALGRIRTASSYLMLPELVLAAERALGLDIDLLAKGGAGGRAQIDRLVSEAHNYARGQDGATLGGFIGWLEAEERLSDGLGKANQIAEVGVVEVLTIHAAKGLERDVVVVPGLAEGTLPSVPFDKAQARAKSADQATDVASASPVDDAVPPLDKAQARAKSADQATDVAAASPVDDAAPPLDAPRSARAWLSGDKRVGGTGGLPWELRLDCSELPQFNHWAAADVVELQVQLDEFSRRAGAHALAEDRRLAYVALTRAKTHLLLTGSWLAGGRKTPQPPSQFLRELTDGHAGSPLVTPEVWAAAPAPPASGHDPGSAVASAPAAPGDGPAGGVPGIDGSAGGEARVGGAVASAPAGPGDGPVGGVPVGGVSGIDGSAGGEARVGGAVASAAAAPGDGPVGGVPGLSSAASAASAESFPIWPVPDPLGVRGPALHAAADAVRAAMSDLAGARGANNPLTRDDAVAYLTALGDPLALDAALLLAEEGRAQDAATVSLPEQMAATTLVALADEPAAQASQLRRPIPRRPSRGAAIGAQFHARVALELAHHAGEVGYQGRLDDSELAAASADAAVDAAVERLMNAWRASDWLSGAYRVWAVEAPVVLDFMGHTVAARVDAVFEDRSGNLVVVDWKTEHSRAGQVDPRHAGQVCFYQAALARSRGIAPDAVRGYVHYVPDNLTLAVTYDPTYLARLTSLLSPQSAPA